MPENPLDKTPAVETNIETNSVPKEQGETADKPGATERKETQKDARDAREGAEKTIDQQRSESNLDRELNTNTEKPNTASEAQQKIETITGKLESGFGKFNKKIEEWMPSLESIGKAFESFMLLFNQLMNNMKFATSTMRINMPSLFGAPDQLIETYASIKSAEPAVPFEVKGDDAVQAKKLMALKPANESNDQFLGRMTKTAQSQKKQESWTMKQLVELMTPKAPEPVPVAQTPAPNTPPQSPNAVPPTAPPAAPVQPAAPNTQAQTPSPTPPAQS